MILDITQIVILIALLLLARVQGGVLARIFLTVIAIQVFFGEKILRYVVSYYNSVQFQKVELLQQQCGNDDACINAAAFSRMGFGTGIEPEVSNIMFLCHALVFLALCISIFRQHRKRAVSVA